MGYFTETMKAILEFKGDAELAYANRRNAEAGTGRHTGTKRNPGGKDAYKKGLDYVNSNDHPGMDKKTGNGNDMVYDKYLGNNAKERHKTYSTTASHMASSTHKVLGRKVRSSCRNIGESFIEAFESLVM